jgi:hypothetical protein
MKKLSHANALAFSVPPSETNKKMFCNVETLFGSCRKIFTLSANSEKERKSVFLLTKGLGLYSQHFILFVIYKWHNKLERLSLGSLSSLV